MMAYNAIKEKTSEVRCLKIERIAFQNLKKMTR